ncbi:MAG TPA: carbohydrate kinase family protein [Magnetospirillaceae bacterium]|nr:carbohydrate kinase family protein [Magnetospirillaceae bacterium]
MAVPRMLAIGSATQDVFLIGGDMFTPKTEHGIAYERLPLGEKIEMQKVVFSTGGNAMNAATTFVRQGLHSQFMGILGTEPAGEAVLKVFDQEGIDTRYLNQADHYHTNYSTILLAPGGERTILTYHGSTLRADGSDINLAAIQHVDWLYVSSVASMTLLERIFTIATKHGVKIAFNPSGRELAEVDKLRPLLEDVSVLIANKEEMQVMVEGRSIDELIHHAAHLVPTVIISDGPRGAVATDGQKVVAAGMYKDVKVVDRLGAGDAFGSGFVAMVAQGKSLEEAVVFASANSTSVVQHHGAKEGILHKGAELRDMPLKVKEL